MPLLTLATPGALLVHLTVLSVAFDGSTVAVKLDSPPTVRLRLEGLSEIEVGFTTRLVTVTSQVAFLPLTVSAVITALPAATAVTLPLLTLATPGALLVHLTVLSVAFDGSTVAVKLDSPPTVRLRLAGFSEIEVGFTTGLVTVTSQMAFLPLTVSAVITALPAATAVTLPLLTLATPGALLVHLTVLSVAFDGSTVAVKLDSPPTVRLRLEGLSETDSGKTVSPKTVTLHEAVKFFFVFTVTVAVPGATAVTIPFSTFATPSLLLFQYDTVS